MPIRADLSTIQETEERSTEAGSSTGIHRTRSRDEEFPSAISQITEASGGYEIPVSAQLGVGQVASSLLMLGGLPSHLDELDEEEASYFTPDGDLPPPRFPSSQQQLSYVSASGGGGGTIPDAFEPSSWNGGTMSSPSVTQWLAQGGGGNGTGTGTTPRQIPSETAAPHKRKWLWRGLFILCLLLVTIAGVIVGMLISGGSDDKVPDSSASAATDRGNGVDGGSSEDTEGTDLTASPVATPSPSSSPTEARFGMVVLPSFPWEDQMFSSPTIAPTAAPTSLAPTTTPTEETNSDETPANGPGIEDPENEDVSPTSTPTVGPTSQPTLECPTKPKKRPPSRNLDSFISRFSVFWNAHTYRSPYGFVGNCNDDGPFGLRARCFGQGTPILFSHPDICSISGDSITCTDVPTHLNDQVVSVEMGCVDSNASIMGMEIAVSSGSTACEAEGPNGFVNFVTASCGEEEARFACPDIYEGELDDGRRVCFNWAFCRGGLAGYCTLDYPGARLTLGSQNDECIEPFSTVRLPGEDCGWDVECASNVCVDGTCREGKGCLGDDCERNEHCRSNVCHTSLEMCTES